MNLFKKKVVDYVFRQLLLKAWMEHAKSKGDNRVITPREKAIRELQDWYSEGDE